MHILGWRRNVLLVEASHSLDSGRVFHHARSLETFCSQNGIRLSLMNGISGTFKSVPSKKVPTPFSSPLFTGSFPSSPLLYSPDLGPQRIGRIDLVPPLSLDGLQSGKTVSSPPESPPVPRQLSLPVRSLHEKLQNSPQVGIVHLALQNDTSGSILSWQNDVFVVAEPGELADKFVQSVKVSLLSMLRAKQRKFTSAINNISTVAELVACRPHFQIGCIVYRYIGRQTQVMEDDQEIGAFMFRRTVPSMHLTPDDVRWMDSLEDISYLLRIPQRKPYGTMEGNVKKALKVNSVRYAAMELGLTVDGDSFVACVMSTREEKAPNCALSARPDTNVSKDHEWRQAVTTAGSGCIAALSVERYLTNNNLLVEFHQPKTEEVKKELTATSADSQAQKLLCRKLQNCRVALFGICLLGNWSWHGVWIVVDVMYAATNADSQAFSGC